MKPTIVMQSDFGVNSGLVACMHGMCKLVDGELITCDITHLLPAFDIEAASYCLQYTVPYWPAGTVFVSVVDPGVGTSRRASVAKLKNGSYVVTPDNGTLTYLNAMIGVEAIREIDEEKNRYQETKEVHTFHGRDLFAYCAAKLASGKITFEEVGKEYPTEEIVLHKIQTAEVREKYVRAVIQSYDPFGSAELSVLNSNFVKAGFKIGEKLHVTIGTDDKKVFDGLIPYERSFGYVGKGEDVLFNNLASFVTIGSNQADFRQKYHMEPDVNYTVEICEA
ncbi:MULTISPECIES: SAM hydrolase/SAM-dependent halogenase family protein [Blautia]|uniref:SAM hydrolase/SAM-dependent halogenase family protein n=1 Tax=Blautia TaxID=572511 RepID=UPI000BA4CEC3|nr:MULTISPECIES: SAM-dependent chlorinase/fluorinase [Blautia]